MNAEQLFERLQQPVIRECYNCVHSEDCRIVLLKDASDKIASERYRRCTNVLGCGPDSEWKWNKERR